jgi:hypothetical protein
VRLPPDADLGHILQLGYELAQDLWVGRPVEKQQPLIFEHPRPASMGDSPRSVLLYENQSLLGGTTSA